VLAHWRKPEEAVQFTTGYLIELSLSLDNILVIALIFSAFRVPPQFQHRVLFWGILGALVMRGAMIAVGAALTAFGLINLAAVAGGSWFERAVASAEPAPLRAEG